MSLEPRALGAYERLSAPAWPRRSEKKLLPLRAIGVASSRAVRGPKRDGFVHKTSFWRAGAAEGRMGEFFGVGEMYGFWAGK